MNTKSQVLSLLMENEGEFLSGAQIAAKLGLSRAGIWKAIESLRAEGHHVTASTNRGYSLTSRSRILTPEGIKSCGSGAVKELNIICCREIDSTNKEAKRLALSGAPFGTVIIAERQSGGVGRFGRSYFCPPGGIYMSVIVDPALTGYSHQTMITAHAALRLCQTIEDVGLSPGIKWVNDIYIGSKKVCGILTEAQMDFESKRISWAVIGIGINFSIPQEAFPEDISARAGSLFYGIPPVTTDRFIAMLLDRLFDFSLPEDALLSGYKSRMNMLGCNVTAARAGESFRCRALDISENGGLVVKLPDGSLQILSSGEISITT